MTPTTLSEPQTSSAIADTVAEALVRSLPGRPLMAQRHAGAGVPPEALAAGVSATYVGARSADLALVLLETDELGAAGGEPGRIRVRDVLRPAFEQASAVVGGGLLGELTEGEATLLRSAEARVYDLVGDAGVAGWFAVLVREQPAEAVRPADVGARLGRISNVELTLTVEIGRAQVAIHEILGAQPGTVIELDRAVGSTADVFLNGRMIAHGEIVVVEQQFAVRVTEVLDALDEG